MPMEKLARHEIEMQANKYHYTICKERRKLVKTTRKLDEEEELVLIATGQLQNSHSLYFLD